MRYTEKYVRSDSRWVKITRDNKERKFTFACGWKNQYAANQIETLSFKWVANWTEAIDRASKMIAA